VTPFMKLTCEQDLSRRREERPVAGSVLWAVMEEVEEDMTQIVATFRVTPLARSEGRGTVISMFYTTV